MFSILQIRSDFVIDFYKFTDKELKMLLQSMVILVDSREQKNLHITSWFDAKKIPYKVMKLEFGDYSFMIPANSELGIVRDLYFDDKIMVERKFGLEELSGNLCNGRSAFESEFIRASNSKVHLMIENALYGDIVAHKYKTDYNPKSFLASLHSLSDRYNFSVTFMPDNKLSAQFIFYTFYYYLRNYLLNR